MKKIDKLIIADELLDKAIECYMDDQKYFSALHLAGAAQEIYGKWIRSNNGQDFSTMMIDEFDSHLDEKIDRKMLKKVEKHSKNTIKHLDSINDRYAQLNPQFDSFIEISGAVIEYARLCRVETKNIARFKEYLMKTKESGL